MAATENGHLQTIESPFTWMISLTRIARVVKKMDGWWLDEIKTHQHTLKNTGWHGMTYFHICSHFSTKIYNLLTHCPNMKLQYVPGFVFEPWFRSWILQPDTVTGDVFFMANEQVCGDPVTGAGFRPTWGSRVRTIAGGNGPPRPSWWGMMGGMV